MSVTESQHAKHIRSVVAGRQRLADNRISLSWSRCLQEYGLDPDARISTDFVSRSQLRERQEAQAPFLSLARLEITNLMRYTAGTGHALLLADGQGVILNYSGDQRFNNISGQLGLQLGALWGESNQGTNAIGTCLSDARAVIVCDQAHFLARNLPLGGAAAPVLDPHGELFAALAAYSEPQNISEHTLVLLKMTAEMIENRCLLALQKSALNIRFHSQPDLIATLGEGLLSISGSGRIAAANRSAAYQLGHDSVAAILGRDIGELFNVTAESIAAQAQDANTRVQAIYETEHGRRFYASVCPAADERRPAASRTAAAPTRSRQADASRGNLASITLDDLDFGDPAMASNIRCARRVLEHDIPVLLYGETGTGKELFAKALHNASNRAAAPYVAVNCASIPETLIESELFGYKGGAFTGARREGNRGKIVQADGGTLFLDEIGDMPLALQGRLLRVLEEREVLPLGSDTPIKVDIRLISATHRDLSAMIAEGLFRDDLYYRLQGIPITLPALRERQDKRELIQRLLAMENDGKPITIEEAALKQLEQHNWPGNLRQLCNVLRTLLVLRDSDSIGYHDLPEDIRRHAGPVSNPAFETANDVKDSEDQAINPLKTAERTALLQALEEDYWNITRVARRFEVSRNTIYRKMRAFNIKPPH